ncbi:MAG: hypothetical protein WDM81_02370 [Rhizomicrobium sp.]
MKKVTASMPATCSTGGRMSSAELNAASVSAAGPLPQRLNGVTLMPSWNACTAR